MKTTQLKPKTARQIAAAILLNDMEMITDYFWQERLKKAGIVFDEEFADDIQKHLDKIVDPFLDRVEKISGGHSLWKGGDE